MRVCAHDAARSALPARGARSRAPWRHDCDLPVGPAACGNAVPRIVGQAAHLEQLQALLQQKVEDAVQRGLVGDLAVQDRLGTPSVHGQWGKLGRTSAPSSPLIRISYRGVVASTDNLVTVPGSRVTMRHPGRVMARHPARRERRHTCT